MQIHVGYTRWKIYRWNDHPNPFRGRNDLALQWVRNFENDGAALAELRNLLGPVGLRGWTNQQILEEVATKLSTGEFQVCAELGHPINEAEMVVVPADPAAAAMAQAEALADEPPPAEAAAAPAAAPAAEETLAEETADDPTFSENTDAAQLAQVLKQAAEDGTPFCEECEKKKAAAKQKMQRAAAAEAAAEAEEGVEEAPPAAPMALPDIEIERLLEDAPTLSSNADPVAIARVLREASARGVPFCEECERARLARQASQN